MNSESTLWKCLGFSQDDTMRSLSRIGVFAPLLLAACVSGGCFRQPGTNEQAPNDEIAVLIDKLQEVAAGDVGYMPTQSGSGFLPLGTSQHESLLLGKEPPAHSHTMRELVKSGAAAIPQLIAHLGDRRPTKITVKHTFVTGGLLFQDEYDYNKRTAKRAPVGVNRDKRGSDNPRNSHIVRVGDLCFVALGQIVNRHFNAVRYQPTACIMVNSPIPSESRLRRAIKKEWGDLTPERHKDSLVRDFVEPDDEDRRIGACLRLGYYYPEELEPLALKQLAAPRYNVFEVESLVREKLYRVNDPNERRTLFDAYIAKRGEVAREGCLLQLFDDLSTQEADEEGRLDPPLKEKSDARACLVELYEYPKTVKSEERPHLLPTDNAMQARFIDALAFFPSAKLDQAVRQVLHSTSDDSLVKACKHYLAGRDADNHRGQKPQ